MRPGIIEICSERSAFTPQYLLDPVQIVLRDEPTARHNWAKIIPQQPAVK
jgi:hypothetical protein